MVCVAIPGRAAGGGSAGSRTACAARTWRVMRFSGSTQRCASSPFQGQSDARSARSRSRTACIEARPYRARPPNGNVLSGLLRCCFVKK